MSRVIKIKIIYITEVAEKTNWTKTTASFN